MRDFEEIFADLRPGHTFSNMSGFEYWALRWCDRCVHEAGCPIVDAALVADNGGPAEWEKISGPEGPFRCTEFKPST